MKKSIFLAAALFAVSVAAAHPEPQKPQPQSQPPQSQQQALFKSRLIDRFWFSVVYTPKFLLSESASDIVPLELNNDTGHNFALEAGYMLTPRLSLGLGAGYERFWTGTGQAVDLLPVYVHANYFYGKRRGGLFNYARIGTLISADEVAKTGFTGGLGVGYRLMFYRRMGVDFKLGYDYSSARINRSYWEYPGFVGSDWSRHSLSLGIGLVF